MEKEEKLLKFSGGEYKKKKNKTQAMHQLIISEKPSAAAKIAVALGDAQKKAVGKVTYFEVNKNGKKIIVVPAVGHLFTLAEKEKTWKYPVFDIDWKPTFEVNKNAAFAKPYFENIKKLTKNANDFVIATDYDIEGEVIGLNILRFICKQKDAKRMKFSTLTAPDLKKAYETIHKTLDWGQAEAGQTRHYLDFYWGINLSKAITDALYLITHRFQPLSIGRVQGPALAVLTERELKIASFKPKPYWQIFILLNLFGKSLKAVHKTEKFWEETKAKTVFEKIRDKTAKITGIKKTKQIVSVPVPFDLTSLQMEAYRCFKISPKETLQLAQELYTGAYISYPRTSSQKLPPALNYKKILLALANQTIYKPLVSKIFKGTLKPKQGKKTDPAHPAIYPTGLIPKSLNSRTKAVYDLIVKRFISVFGNPGEREFTAITFEIDTEPFILKGARTTKPGWQELYKPYVKREETELPAVEKGQTFDQKSNIEKKKTEPPKRYSPATIIKELEKENLGTKATRASIIDTLFQRGYVKDTAIQVTKLGQEIIKTFENHAPEILSKKLTRKFEQEMEQIRAKKLEKEKILQEAEQILIKLCKEISENKAAIGKSLATAFYETRKKESTLMKCLVCKEGDLKIIVSKKTGKRFLACNNYPKCKTTWPLPQAGMLKIQKTKCKDCNTPKIVIYKRGRKPWIICPNPNCPSKKE